MYFPETDSKAIKIQGIQYLFLFSQLLLFILLKSELQFFVAKSKQFQEYPIIFIGGMLDCVENKELLPTPDYFQSLFLLRKACSTSTLLIQADFSLMKHELVCLKSPTKAVPQFNMDCKPYTPAFILALDESKYLENEQIYRDLHNRKTAQMSQQKAELFLPKPSKNNSYCCVCKIHFDDYLTHVRMQRHLILMRKSECNARINDLCSMFKVQHQKESPKKRRGRPPKIMKVKTISKMLSLKRISSKETSAEDSLKSQPSQISIIV